MASQGCHMRRYPKGTGQGTQLSWHLTTMQEALGSIPSAPVIPALWDLKRGSGDREDPGPYTTPSLGPSPRLLPVADVKSCHFSSLDNLVASNQATVS